MLKRLIDFTGAADSHPQSAAIRPPRDPVVRGDDVIRVMEPWIGDDEARAVGNVLDSGMVSTAGPAVREFEAALARACGTKHAFAVTCGTHALDLLLHCNGVGPGDEVIVPALAFISVGSAVAARGARPVFVDAERTSLNLDPAQVEAAITPRTRGLIGVHTFGHPCDMDALMAIGDAHGIFVIEDACEGLGASLRGRPTGGLGDAAIHSFYANKTITTGNGGAITTDSDELAELVAELRGYSYTRGHLFWHHHLPFNLRISAMQAAMGTAQLAKLDRIIEDRRALRQRYAARLDGVPGLTLPTDCANGRASFWMVTIHVDSDRHGRSASEVRHALAAAGIETRAVFAPLHAQPVLQEAAAPAQGPFPVAEWAARTGINLPSNPRLTDAQLDRIADVLRSA
jgi:perosamine synthetase